MKLTASAATSSLSIALAAMVEMLAHRTIYEQENHIISGLPQVALIIIQGPRIIEADFTNAQTIISHSVRSHPDLNYVFVTNDVQLVNDLFQVANNFDTSNQTRYHIIQENTNEIDRIDSQLRKLLMQFPRRIIAATCKEEFR